MNTILIGLVLLPIFTNLSSLDTIESGLADNESKVNKYNKLALRYYADSLEKAISFTEQAYEIAYQLADDSIRATSLLRIGKLFIKMGKHDKALETINEAGELFKKMKLNTGYLETLLNLGKIHFNRTDYLNSMICYEEMLKISTKIENNGWIAVAQHGIGSTYYSKGEYEPALKAFIKSFNILEESKDDTSSTTMLCMIGATYSALSNYDKAIDYLLKSLTMSQLINDTDNESLTYHAIGIIYERLKNYKLAIKYNKNGLRIAEKYEHTYNSAHILDHTGKIYYQMFKFDSANYYINKSLKYHILLKNEIGKASTYDHLGDIHFMENKYLKALTYYNDAWDTIEKIDEKYRKSKILTHLGVVYTKLNKFPLAHEKLKQGMELARITKAQDLVKEGLLAFSEYYASTKDFDHAYKNLLTYSQLRDSIFTVSSHHIAEMQMRYETGKREKENKLLRNQIEIHKLEIDKNKIKSWLSYLSLIVVSMIGFFSYNRYRSKKKANIVLEDRIRKALQKQEEQQHIIFHQASLSSLGELAAGMAHEINQPLQNIKLATESIELDSRNFLEKHPAIRESIQEIYHAVERIRHLINHVRLFSSQQANHIHELFRVNPVIDNALMLVRKQYLKKGIQIKTILDKKPYKIEGNPFKFEQVVINILSNAKDALIEKEKKLERYFQKEISIETIKNDNQVIMRITDNGSGINMDNEVDIFHPFYTTKKLGKGSGLGLSIVQGIVTEMKGTISFTSGQSTGTTIEIKLPISVRRKSTTRRNKK